MTGLEGALGGKSREELVGDLTTARQAHERAVEAAESLAGIETQLIALRENIIQYEVLELTFSGLAARLGSEAPAELIEIYPEAAGGGSVGTQVVLARWSEALDWRQAAEGAAEGGERDQAIAPLYNSILLLIETADYSLALFPSEDGEVEKWQTAGELLQRKLDPAQQDPTAEELALFSAYAQLAGVDSDVSVIGPAVLTAFQAGKDAAAGRGEFEKIPMEVSYYKRDYFTKALVFFLLGFLTVAISWLRRCGRLGHDVHPCLGNSSTGCVCAA